MLAEEGKRNWVLVVAIVLVILFVGGVIASFLSTPAVEPPKAIKAELKDGSVVLTWEPPETAVDGYRVYRGLVGEKPQLIAEIPSSQPPTYADSSVKEGKEYVYYLTSYKGSEESVKSPPVSVYIEPFPPYDVKLEVLDVCAGDGDIVVSFSAKRADGCSFSFNARDWKDYPLDASPITLRPPAQLSEGGEAYLYMKCYRMVDGKRVESDVLRASITSDVLPPQLYGDVKVEEGKAIVKVSSNEELKGCTAFAGPQPLGSFEKEATFALPPGEYLLTISCQDECGNTNFLAYPVENNYQEIEVNNTTYRIGLEINNGAASTTSREVVLNIVSENFKECRFANDEDVALNAWSDWEPARDEWEKPWVLAACDGKRSVYMQCRDGDVSYTVKDSIYCGVVESNDTNATGAVSAYAMGVVDRYIVADNTIQPILAGDLEGQSANLHLYTGGFFFYSFDRNESEEMQRYYTGGFFVFGMPVKECTTKEPVLRKVSSLSPDVTKTGEVYLSFSQPVDRVEVLMGPNKVAVEKVSPVLYKVPAPLSVAVGEDQMLSYKWRAYRAVDNEEKLVGEGVASILWDRTPPKVSVSCEGDRVLVDSKEDLQLIYLTASTGSSDYYCYHQGKASFRLPTTGGVAVKGKVYDKAGHEADVSGSCSLSSPAFEVYGLVDVCSPEGDDVVCEEGYVVGLSKGEQGKVVINTNADGGTLEGFFAGFKATACDPRFSRGEFEGTFTARVPEGSTALHTVTYTPCVDGREEGEPVEATVFIDRAPPTISGVACEEVPSKTGTSYVCTISAKDESGIAAYKLEVCNEKDNPPKGDSAPLRAGWCSGSVERYASTSPIFVFSDQPAGKVRAAVWDSAGNYAELTTIVGDATPEVSIDLEGTVTTHRLEMAPSAEVPGAYEPRVVSTSTYASDVVTSNPVVKLNPRYDNVEVYRITAFAQQFGESSLLSADWHPAPIPTTYELPSATGLWTVKVEGAKGELTASAEDTIYLDVSPPQISLNCRFLGSEDTSAVVCDYSASDNLALPSPQGMGAPNKGIGFIEAYAVVKPSSGVALKEKVYGPVLLTDAVGTFSIPIPMEEEDVTVYALVEDQAGNYAVERTFVGTYTPPTPPEVEIDAVGVVRHVEEGVLFSFPDELLSPHYLPVVATNSWEGLYVGIAAQNAQECGYCISFTGDECKVTDWHPYEATPAYYPLQALTTSEGRYTIWAQCRAEKSDSEYIYSPKLSYSFVVDTTPPYAALKVEPTVLPEMGTEPTSLLAPKVYEGVTALLWEDDGSCCAYSCSPEIGDLDGCNICCADYIGDGGGSGGGSGSSCNYGACPTPYEDITPFTHNVEWSSTYVTKVVVVPPFSYVSDARCSLVFVQGDEEVRKGSCSSVVYGATYCCSGSTPRKTQMITYRGFLHDLEAARVCRGRNGEMDVYLRAEELVGDPDYSTEWRTVDYSVGTLDCSKYQDVESEMVEGMNDVRISAGDSLSGLSLVIVYRQIGAYDAKTGSITPEGNYEIVKTYITPRDTSFAFSDYIPYSADEDTAEDGYLFYRYKVAVYDKARNFVERYTDWVAPYSVPSAPAE